MTTIQVRTRFEGVHCYPSAPKEVEYLREPHRHIFGVCVEVEVFSEDRELEFIMVKHMIDGYINNLPKRDGYYQLHASSCEHIAKALLSALKSNIGKADERYWKVTVDEDGENGASVESYGVVHADLQSHQSGGATMPMSLDEYQVLAYQNIQEHSNQKEEIMHWAIGLGEEAGEALSVVKHRYYAGCYKNNDDMLEDLINELGDVLWHVSALCTVLGIGMEDVAKYNLAKLDNRYPSGVFDKDRSERRHNLYSDWKGSKQHNDLMDQIKKKRWS